MEKRECIKCGFHMLDHEETCSFCLAGQDGSGLGLGLTLKRVAVVLSVILVLVAFGLYSFCHHYVPKGHVGVVIDKNNGIPQDETLPSGRHFVNRFLYDVKNVEIQIRVPPNDALRIREGQVIRFRLPERLLEELKHTDKEKP